MTKKELSEIEKEQREIRKSVYKALNEMMPEGLEGGAIYWTEGLWIYPDGTTEYL